MNKSAITEENNTQADSATSESLDNQSGNYDGYHKEDSKKALLNGRKFEFKDGSFLIECWVSSYSGKQIIKVNGQPVSTKRNLFKRQSLHSFVFEGVRYEVEFNVISLMTGELHCVLIKDGTHLETQKNILTAGKDQIPYNAKTVKKDFVIYTVLGFISGVIASIFISVDDVPAFLDKVGQVFTKLFN